MADCIYDLCVFNGDGECKDPCKDIIPISFQTEWHNHKGDHIKMVYFRSRPGYFWEKQYTNGRPPKRPRRITRKDYVYNYHAIQEEKEMMEAADGKEY